MQSNFTTIDEYIAQFDNQKQALLQEVRRIIAQAAPEATETINYQMPTFRYHGNLIHFALFKNHLGIYPGPEAIEHFADELTAYKTSKGAVQIPLSADLPIQLLKKMVHFNVQRLKDKSTPDWKRHQPQWAEAVERIQQILNELPLTRTFKWGSDVYTHNGKNIVSYGGFKNHFAIWFYNGVFLSDEDGVLVNASEGKTKALRQWRFSSADEMNATKIRQYVQEAIQNAVQGKEVKQEKRKGQEPAGLLKEALTKNSELHKAFNSLTPGKQREYMEYVDEAKQEKTKMARIEKITPLIFAGRGLHDKYRR